MTSQWHRDGRSQELEIYSNLSIEASFGEKARTTKYDLRTGEGHSYALGLAYFFFPWPIAFFFSSSVISCFVRFCPVLAVR